MKTAKEMQKLVVDLCRRMKVNLDEKEAYLKLKLDEKHIPLVIQRLTDTTVRVAHEFVSDGGMIMADPEVVFYTLYDEWIPIESTQPISNNTTLGQFDGNRRYAELSSTGKYIKYVDFDYQKNLAVFVKNWFKCLKADGWGEYAANANFKQDTLDDAVKAAELDESHMVEGELVYAALPAGRVIELGEQ